MLSSHRTAIFASAFLAGFTTFAFQQTSGATLAAEQATELLARSQAIQQKCKFLNANQNQQLSSFVAKAEIAMVSKSSTKAAKTIIANGRAQGQKATCSDVERADIVDVLNAAQQATAASKPAASKPAKIEKPIQIVAAAKKPALEPVQKPVRADGLANYAQLTKRYYLARRCNSMSTGAISSLYRNVVATHRNVVSNFGIPTVRNVMQQSEQSANQSSCG
jgi:hypothetical protein